MRLRAAIHLADAARSLESGAVELALGHLLAAGAGHVQGQAVALALRDRALLEASEMRAVQATPDALRRLAVILALDRSGVVLRDLVGALADANHHELVTTVTADLDEAWFESADDFIITFRRRRHAQRLAAGASKEAAERGASEDCLAPLDRLIAKDPVRRSLRIFRAGCYAAALRYRDFIEELKGLVREGEQQPFVTENLVLMLRSLAFPEVRHHLDQIVARLGPDVEKLREWHMVLLSMPAHQQGLRLAETLTEIIPGYAIVAPLHALVHDLDRAPARSFGKPAGGRHLIYASIVCWGAPYVEKMGAICFSSLLASGNMPALCAENDVVLEIMTDAEGVAQIAELPTVLRLAEHCQIKIFVLPDEVRIREGRLNYVIYGYASHFTIRRAQRDGADLLFLLPDLLYGDGSLRTVAEIVTRDRRVFFVDGLNAAATPVMAALQRHRNAEGALTISCRQLCEIAGDHLMPRTLDNIYDPARTENCAYSSRVTFRTATGLIIHSFTKLPVYASHAAFKSITDHTFSVPDAYFSQDLLDRISRDELFEIASAEKFLLVELSDSEGYVLTKQPITIEESILQTFRFDKRSERTMWLFETGVEYPMAGPNLGAIMDEEGRRAVVEGVLGFRDTHPIFTELIAERRKHLNLKM